MDTLETIQQLKHDGQIAAARAQCKSYLAAHPASEAALTTMLTLDATPAEEVAVLESLLRYYPTHSNAGHFRQQLNGTRLLVTLHDLMPDLDTLPRPPGATPVLPPRLGEDLLRRGIINNQQLTDAIHEQARLHQNGSPQRLGTILVRMGAVTPEQLAEALRHQGGRNITELGEFLVHREVITREQLSHALQHQAEMTQQNEQRYQQKLEQVIALQNGRWNEGALNRPTQSLAMPIREPQPRIGEVLIKLGYLKPEELTRWLREQRLIQTIDA
ncbi:MAG: hypothetical protein NVS4B8_30150 [Herpetosiphon sp.]